MLIIKKKREFCFLSLGDGFVLIGYFGVCLFYLYCLFYKSEFHNVFENIITWFEGTNDEQIH